MDEQGRVHRALVAKDRDPGDEHRPDDRHGTPERSAQLAEMRSKSDALDPDKASAAEAAAEVEAANAAQDDVSTRRARKPAKDVSAE